MPISSLNANAEQLISDGSIENSIEAVIFDVGWVLLHLNFQPLLACLAQSGRHYEIKEVIAAIDLEAHERGEIGGMVLIDRMQSLAPEAQRPHLHSGWLNMFEPVEAMFELARQLSKTYRVYLLSNVGDLHWAHVNAQYGLRNLAHDVLPSFEAGAMKPDAKIYRLAEERFGLTPARTVFIDDLEPNVVAARQRGWHAIQHASPEQTIHSLRALGIDC